MRRVDRMKIPGDLDFQSIAGLTREAVEKLERARPATLGEVKRMPGMTPAAVMNLFVHLSLKKRAEPAR